MGNMISSTTEAAMGLLGGGGDAASASQSAANTAASAQMAALEYLKQQNKLPTEIRDQALGFMQDVYFGEGGLDAIQQNPMYQMMTQGGEEAVLRNASATGGLRGGGSISDVASFQNQAMQNTMGGIQGLAGIGTNENQIANLMTGIGNTQAQGIMGSAQAQMQGNQNMMNNLLGLGSLGVMAFSDERLKDNIKPTGYENGIPTYKWDWNDKARKLGLSGSGYGTLSKVVKEIMPEAVSSKDGYDQVNYSLIGVKHG